MADVTTTVPAEVEAKPTAKAKSKIVERLSKLVPDKVHTWPYLVRLEMLVGTIVMALITIWSIVVDAPLEEPANPTKTPNPSKAPWYLLNLQELLLHMDKGLAGVIVPTIWLTFMAVIPYIDTSREGVGIYFTSANGKRIAIFSAVYTSVLTFSLILLDAFLKIPEDRGGFGYIEKASRYLPGGKQLFPNYLIPIAVMLGLTFLLVYIVKRLWGANTREWMIAVFTGFVAVYLVLVVVGTSMRGPGMDLFPPWGVPSTHQCLEPNI